MKDYRFFILFLVMTVAAFFLQAQADNKEEKTGINDRIAKLLAEYDRLDRPGGVIAIVKEGSVVYQKGHGLANLEYMIPNTPKTLYDIAAVANAFTGMAIAVLEQEGKLSLEDDVRKYIPAVPDFGKTISLRHLVYHTSGLLDWPDRLSIAGWRMEDVITFDHIMKIVQSQKKLEYDPGEKYNYSSTNYYLLAEVVKQVTEKSFRDWTWENIFRPLGMTKTLFRENHREIVENRAYSYIYLPREGYLKGADNLAAAGSGNLFTNLEDLVKWIMNLETGKVGGKALIQKMIRGGKRNDGKEIEYGYGLAVDTYKGLKRVSCTGSWGGFTSVLKYFPEQKLGIVMMVNWSSLWENPYRLSDLIAEFYLEPYLEKEKPSIPAVSPPKKEKVTVNTAVLDQYIGTYRLRPGVLLNVTRKEDHLMMGTQYGSFELLPESPTRFFIQFAFIRITFQKNNDGKVDRLIFHQAGEDTPSPKVELVKPTPQELQEYTGRYYCEELAASYTIIPRDQQVVLTHQRNTDVLLTPEARDHFSGNSQLFPLVVFTRDKELKINGFKIEYSQMGDIFFQKK